MCNGIGEPWIQLPDITPKHICIARQIYKSFTGNLETDICTYPEFPGKEKELLRTQIARISASKSVSIINDPKFTILFLFVYKFGC